MKKISSLEAAAFIIWLLPFAYLLVEYPTMPASMPMHYDLNGEPNRYGSKIEFLLVIAGMAALSAGTFFLLKYLPSIDPKKQVQYGQGTMEKISLGIISFISILMIIVTFAGLHEGLKIEKLLFPLISLLFAFLGNMMHSIKPNYFVGVRVPWTLENEDNWKSTHRMASKLWFYGGLALTLATLMLPSAVGAIVFQVSIILLALIPVGYSFIYFKRHSAN